MNKRVYKVLEFDKILKMLAGKAVSDSAKILAEKLVPKKELEGASRLMKETVEAESITLRFSNSPITSFSDCSSEIKRLKTQGNLNCKELLRLTGVFKSARTAKANIKR